MAGCLYSRKYRHPTRQCRFSKTDSSAVRNREDGVEGIVGSKVDQGEEDKSIQQKAS